MADAVPAAAAPAATPAAAAAAPANATPAAAPAVAAAKPADATPAPAADAKPADAAVADWRAGITDPDQLEFAKRIASPADAVKVALDLRKANSAMVKLPGKDAKAEDIAKFNKSIGVPESVEAAEKLIDLGRAATDADKPIMSAVAKVMVDAGVPGVAIGAVTKAVADIAAAQQAEQNRVAVEARAATEASLKKEWGADYDANVNLAKRAFASFGEVKGHPEALDFFDKTLVNGSKLGDHPIIQRIFGNIGRRMGEGEFIGAVGGSERQSMQTELDQIMRDNPPGTEKYKSSTVQNRVRELTEAIHGNGGSVGLRSA